MAHYINEYYGGGIVFHVDETGEHGLIAAYGEEADIDSTWQHAFDTCKKLSLGGYNDWYLPDIDELNLMYKNIGQGAAEPNTNAGDFEDEFYWSSSVYEFSDLDAWHLYFYNGVQNLNTKWNRSFFRAVRSF